MEKILDVKNLSVKILEKKRELILINDLNLSIHKKQIVGLAGESGSGKSMTALSIARLLPPHIEEEGQIFLGNTDLTKLKKKSLNKIRAEDLSIIFQEPFRALNPLIRAGKQVEEVLKIHTNLSRQERKEKILSIFDEIGLTDGKDKYHAYPHQLSGGINQRIMIAIAAILKPKLLIADEPTTALDVTVQKQILNLMKKLRDKNDTSILLISHDLALASEICDYIYVMYAGQIVESGRVHDIFSLPKHPYTKALLKAIPRVGKKVERLYVIDGAAPRLSDKIKGCAFYPRCNEKSDICMLEQIPLCSLDDGSRVRCIKYTNGDNIN